jgi:hypothetical protein
VEIRQMILLHSNQGNQPKPLCSEWQDPEHSHRSAVLDPGRHMLYWDLYVQRHYPGQLYRDVVLGADLPRILPSVSSLSCLLHRRSDLQPHLRGELLGHLEEWDLILRWQPLRRGLL